MNWQSIKRELKAGWNDASWIGYFYGWLCPGMLLALLLDQWIEGPLPPSTQPPRPLEWILMIPGVLFAIWKIRHHLARTFRRRFRN